MCRTRSHSLVARSDGPAGPRAYTLVELMVILGIIGVILAVAVPSFTNIRRDLETRKARSDVYAALAAARSRAITSRSLVALHVFRDTGVYQVARASANPNMDVNYDRADPAALNAFRWGVNTRATNSATQVQTGNPQNGLPHEVPSNRMVLRLEVPNPDSAHNLSLSNIDNAIEFHWPADHDPVILPPSVGVCRPRTPGALYVPTEMTTSPAQGLVNFAEDFYIVFAEDGRVCTVLADYDLNYNTASPATNNVQTGLVDAAGALVAPRSTWSAGGLCLYDPLGAQAAFSRGTTPAQQELNRYQYVNQSAISISAYTGLPLEATR